MTTHLLFFIFGIWRKTLFAKLTCIEASGIKSEVTVSRDVFFATRGLIIVTFEPFRQLPYFSYQSLVANQMRQ